MLTLTDSLTIRQIVGKETVDRLGDNGLTRAFCLQLTSQIETYTGHSRQQMIELTTLEWLEYITGLTAIKFAYAINDQLVEADI
jgi:hypothetical protein